MSDRAPKSIFDGEYGAVEFLAAAAEAVPHQPRLEVGPSPVPNRPVVSIVSKTVREGTQPKLGLEFFSPSTPGRRHWGRVETDGGSSSGVRSPVCVMAPNPSPAGVAKDLLPDLIEGSRGRALRVQLAGRHPECPVEDIEEAVQAAAADFLAEGDGITDHGAAYAWLRTAAHRILGHEAVRRRREVTVDPLRDDLERPAPPRREPAEELVAAEDTSELTAIVQELVGSFSPRRRQAIAPWAPGRRRPQIAAELSVRERVVKREVLEIMEEGRVALARRSEGGCEQGERLVSRFACGLASIGGSRAGTSSPRALSALLGLRGADEGTAGKGGCPPAAGGSGGEARIGRLAPRSSPRIRLVGWTGGRRRRSPPAAWRWEEGATYCVQHGVEPLGAATGLIPGAPGEPKEEPSSSKSAPEAPVGPAPEEAPVYEPAAEEAGDEVAPTHELQMPSAKVEPEPEPVAAPAPEEVTPPPEQAFEPASPDYPATESTS